MKLIILTLLVLGAIATHRVKDQHLVDKDGLRRIYHG
jgi:hypothetical protein